MQAIGEGDVEKIIPALETTCKEEVVTLIITGLTNDFMNELKMINPA